MADQVVIIGPNSRVADFGKLFDESQYFFTLNSFLRFVARYQLLIIL